MEPENLLPHLQEPATCPCPEPGQSSPYFPSNLSKIHFNIILPATPGLPSSLLFQVSPPKLCVHLSSSTYVLHAIPNSLFLILSPE